MTQAGLGKGVQDFGMTLGSRIGALATGIATQSILAWTLGPDERGSLVVCLLFATVLVMSISIGFDYGAIYFVSSKRFTVSEGLFYTATSGLLLSVAGMALGWWLLDLPVAFFTKASRESFLLALLFVPASMFGGVFLRLLTAVHLFKHFAIVTLLNSIFQLGLTAVFVWGLKWGVRGGLMASILTNVLVFGICLAIFLTSFEIRSVRPSWGRYRELFSFGSRNYLGKISNMTNMHIGTILLAFFATRTEIGWFAIAARLAKLVEVIPEAFTAVLFPRMAEDPEGRKDLAAHSARVVTVVCGGIFLGLAVFATPFVRIVFSPEFLPSVPLIRILAIGGFLFCTAKIFLSFLIAIGRPGIASIVVTIGVAVNVVLIWVLLPRMGIAGAAWAMTGNYVVSSVILVGLASKYSKMSLREIFAFSSSDWAEIGRMVRRRRSSN